MTQANGDIYEGERKDGMAHGWGTYTQKDGRQYVGNEIQRRVLHREEARKREAGVARGRLL